MSVDERSQIALDLKNIPAPPYMPVERVEVEDLTDWTGDPSLRILVVLKESADVETAGGQAIGDYKSAIRASVREHGIPVFAYIFFAKPSELVETDEE